MGEIIKLDNVSKEYKLYKNEIGRLKNLISKKVNYKKKVAVKNISFSINRGETVALIGKNGAGKSTILKMITGVTFPTKGEITVNGRVSALLELTAGFNNEFTGRENIYIKGMILGIPQEEIKKKEKEILEFAGIGEYIDQPIRTYSSGMKARLGFAIIVNIEPEILIVDEALSVGDAEFKEKCRKKIEELLAKDDITLLFVTHALATAKEFCKRGIIVKNGEVVKDAPIDEAIKSY